MLGVGGVRAWNIISIQVLLGIINYFIINSAHYLLDMDFDFAFCVARCSVCCQDPRSQIVCDDGVQAAAPFPY